MRLAVVAALLVLAPKVAPAQDPAAAPPSPTRFALTIYSSADPRSFDPRAMARARDSLPAPGFGVVREVRPIELKAGLNEVRLDGVAAAIDPTTVSFRSLTAPDTTAVVEQDFRYDLADTDAILRKYVDKSVTLRRPASGGGEAEELQGTLLSFDDAAFVLRGVEGRRGGVRIIPRGKMAFGGGDDYAIDLPALPEGLVTRPTLAWAIRAEQAGQHEAEVTYHTDGLTWRADYTATVAPDEATLDLSAWVTILNESGASYPDARLKLVAGDVQRIEIPLYAHDTGVMAGMGGMGGREEGFAEKSFFEYHLYTLGRPTSIPDRSTKQIELFPARRGVPAKKLYVYDGRAFDEEWSDEQPAKERALGPESNPKVDVYVALRNDEASGLGLPLPAGRVRVSKRDEADGLAEFIGEDTINHTPKDEDLLIKTGSAFDVVGERRQTKYEASLAGRAAQRSIVESFEIRLRNHKAAPITVIVKEEMFRWLTWEITESSTPFEKRDARMVHFPVEVPADGSATVTYTVRYTW